MGTHSKPEASGTSERSSGTHFFWKSKAPKEPQQLRGGTQERSKNTWFMPGLGRSSPSAPPLPGRETRHVRAQSLDETQNVIADPDTGGGKKAHHRRSGSLSDFFRKSLGLRRRSESIGSADEFDSVVGAGYVPGASSDSSPQTNSRFAPSAGATPNGTPRTTLAPLPTTPNRVPSLPSSGTLSCFGLGPRAPGDREDAEAERVSAEGPGGAVLSPRPLGDRRTEAEGPLVPAAREGVVEPLRHIGIRNVGNSCFVSTALQCLRHTPGLAVRLAPGLANQIQEAASGALGAEESGHQLDEPTETVDVHALGRAGAEPTSLEPDLRDAAGGGGICLKAPDADPAEGGPCSSEAGAGEPHEAAAGGDPSPPSSIELPEREAETDASRQTLERDTTRPDNGEPSAPTVAESSATDKARLESPLGGRNTVTGLPLSPYSGFAMAATPCRTSGAADADANASLEVPETTDVKPQRPAYGELLGAYAHLLAQLYTQSDPQSIDPRPFIKILRRFPMAADFLDGGQHDCQEVLRVLMDLLHDDLKPPPPEVSEPGEERAGPSAASPLPSSPRPTVPAELSQPESTKSRRHWQEYLSKESSPVTELFGGQLQSSITCHKCGRRFTMYEPFWDLSLPLAKEGKQGGLSWLGLRNSPATIMDCLAAFTSDERLEGEEAFSCAVCKSKTPATKHLRLERLPQILVLHIKRFKYRGFFTDKLTAAVSFPLSGLCLDAALSPEAIAEGRGGAVYDLFAVSNHYGNLLGGHYTAMCQTLGGSDDGWYCYNDEVVNRMSEDQVVSQYAYILFYARRPGTGGKDERL